MNIKRGVESLDKRDARYAERYDWALEKRLVYYEYSVIGDESEFRT